MGLKINQKVPQSLLDTEILKQDESTLTFNDILNNEDSLIVMVRHFGCLGCTTQMLAIAPKLDELESLGIKVKIIGNGQVQYIEGFIEKFGLEDKEVEIYTDPSLKIYAEAEMKRSVWRLLNPVNLWEILVSLKKGIGQKTIEGDNFQMGGAMLLSDSAELQYYFQNKTIAGIADTNEIMKQVHKFVLKKNVNLL